jgi:hypothetical protein
VPAKNPIGFTIKVLVGIGGMGSGSQDSDTVFYFADVLVAVEAEGCLKVAKEAGGLFDLTIQVNLNVFIAANFFD